MRVQNCIITTPTAPYPLPVPWSPWGIPGPDQELERLRRMKRQAEQEEEKRQIRDWLQRHGVNPYPAPPLPMVPFVPGIIAPRPVPFGPSVDEVLRRIR